MSPLIHRHDFGEGDVAYTAKFPIPPFKKMLIAGPDDTPDSLELLKELGAIWELIWPSMLERLQAGMADYGVDYVIGRDEFMGFVSRCEKDTYLADQSDLFLRLEFNDPPCWDFFLDSTRIVHFQPVF